MNAKLLGCLLVATLASAAAHGQTPTGPRYERDGRDWYRVDAQGRYRVDPRVVSVRFRPPIVDLAGFQAALATDPAAPASPASLRTVRSNRLGIHDLELPAGADVFEVLAALRASGRVLFAEENTIGRYVIGPDDPQFGQQWALENTGQQGGVVDADIDADLAWDITGGDPSVVIAVLDSGTEITHPDLSENTWINPGEIPGNNVDDDNNGFIDDVFGWDFNNGNNQVPGPFFHGTFVTGIVSARTNNSTGIAGVAGGFFGGDGCLTLAVGVGDFFPNSSILDDAIIYAADNGAHVITLSLQVGPSSAIDMALDYARNTVGVFIDCAAGNGGGPVAYPANNGDVAAIASSTRFDTKSDFSNPGPQVWVAAPGSDIRSTDTGGGYTDSSGTSFAAPHVAATIGLVLAEFPALSISVDGLENVLKVSADDIEAPGFDNGTGWGRINAHGALTHVQQSDCNQNGIYDFDDIAAGTSPDANGNGIPDECECTPAINNYCISAPNSVGPGATLSAFGSASVSANDLILQAVGVPPQQFALFIYGANQTQAPLFEGFLCVDNPFFRLPVSMSDNLGTVTFALDIDNPPQPAGQITVGSTWNFQLFYRDPAGAGSQSNLSDALEILFCE